jgi:hypothetical protein
MDLKQHLIRMMAFSHATYGPGERTDGLLDHIAKEVEEVRRSGGKPEEWVDIVILALDGLTRSLAFADGDTIDMRGDPDAVARDACLAILAKQSTNERRSWPDWRTADTGKAIEHTSEPDHAR